MAVLQFAASNRGYEYVADAVFQQAATSDLQSALDRAKETRQAQSMRDRQDDDEGNRQTRSLAALALLLALALIALSLIIRLRHEGEIEDCLMAGRTNCDALIDTR